MDVLYPRCARGLMCTRTRWSLASVWRATAQPQAKFALSTQRHRGCWRCQLGSPSTNARMSRWRRPACTGSRSGTSWRRPVALILANAATCPQRPGPQDRRGRCTVAGRVARARSDPPQFRATDAGQEMRELTRTRKQLVREQASHVQRIQKTLEDAQLKLGSGFTQTWGFPAARYCRH